MWIPISSLLWIDFGMIAPRQLLLKQGGKTLELDYGKDLIMPLYEVKGIFVLLLQEENKA